ncbi:MAG: hypothetical protein D6696_05935 [Acidobacteria bacterium]|nr:MAG: hypothetical protein D6696_05935 [Acidobacteriota bacterium]
MHSGFTLPRELAPHVRRARELVRDRRRGGPEHLPTGVAAWDELLAGGLRRGATVELVGRPSSGRFALVLALLAAVTGSGEAAALVDLGDGLDPQAARACGVDLERLLWLRPRTIKEALAGAETVLGCGPALVVVDLGLPPLAGGRGAEAAWLRLARAARARRTALVVSSPYRASGTAAAVVLELGRRRSLWRSGGGAPPLLCGLRAGLAVLKDRGRRPGACVALRFDLESAVAAAGDDERAGCGGAATKAGAAVRRAVA